jgi:uncharacterized protein (TIGR04255 family)
MSKLPHAPLQEVSAQLKWHLKSEEFSSYGFLAGDYYHHIKEKFQDRESIAPEGIPLQLLINNPTHKFYTKESEFPFFIIGPGIIGLNVNDENYFWEDFVKQIDYTFTPVFEIVPSMSEFDHIHLSLEYIDFFEFDFKNNNIIKFLSESLNTEFNQPFASSVPNGIDLNLTYKDQELGTIKFSYNKGKVKGKEKGLIVRTTIDSGIFPSDKSQTIDWFDKAHKKCSILFKEMTKGELYESFK